MAFTTIQGSGANDATSFVGSAGVDTILIQNVSSSAFVGAQASADVINFANFQGLSTGYSVYGGQGDDQIGQAGAPISFSSSFFNGNSNADSITAANVTSSTLFGGQGADSINATGLISGSRINGNKDGDTLAANFGLTGASLFGGQGNDAVTLNTTVSSSVVQGDNDNDTITIAGVGATTIGGSTINGNAGNDQILFGANAVSTFVGTTVFGGSGNDTINANANTGTAGIIISGDVGNDSMTGSVNADTIFAGSGNDGVLGSTGADALTAGSGIDTFSYTNPTDGAAFVAGSTATGDAITGFTVSEDLLNFATNLGAAQLTGVVQAGVNAIAYGAGVDFNGAGTGDDSVQFVAAGAATANVNDLVTLADLNTALGAIANDAANDERILVFLAQDNSYAAYYYNSVGAGAALLANELTLLATGRADGALTAANIVAGA